MAVGIGLLLLDTSIALPASPVPTGDCFVPLHESIRAAIQTRDRVSRPAQSVSGVEENQKAVEDEETKARLMAFGPDAGTHISRLTGGETWYRFCLVRAEQRRAPPLRC